MSSSERDATRDCSVGWLRNFDIMPGTLLFVGSVA